ncbi:hypothetical protein DOTSEDRAFT_34483 [Dothistroma septosporum NZE10]|uniref:Uncharacterized protein n=1 Tax=Dothistroma septosporum (strain NZE10 / CBS 128990) TaxID=675120 RepID=N1PND2_DOTSN|nr:hypothetical protein DOTSEDRAFT_34483 [Dothistroma septosporum NZE10]
MLEEVICVYKRDLLQRLKDIAEHVSRSQQVRALYFQAERFRRPLMTTQEWELSRLDCLPFSGTTSTTHGLPGMGDGMNGVSEPSAILNAALDTECLAELFRACSKLEEVALTLVHWSKAGTDVQRTAYKDCMVDPGGGDESILDAGVDQSFSLFACVENNHGEVIPPQTWPKLRELGLSGFETAEDELVELLSVTKTPCEGCHSRIWTLQMVNVGLSFRRIGSKLPKVHKIKLSGSFLELGVSHLHFGVLGERSQHDPVCDTIEELIQYGGELPPFSDLLDEEKEWYDSQDEGINDHESPSRIDEADAGYSSDGFVVSYCSDDVGRTI